MGLHVTHHGFDPFQMAWGQHEEEVRVVHIQPTVDGQQQAFFALMRTAGDQKTPAYDQGSKRMRLVGLGSREQARSILVLPVTWRRLASMPRC